LAKTSKRILVKDLMNDLERSEVIKDRIKTQLNKHIDRPEMINRGPISELGASTMSGISSISISTAASMSIESILTASRARVAFNRFFDGDDSDD